MWVLSDTETDTAVMKRFLLNNKQYDKLEPAGIHGMTDLSVCDGFC